MRVNVFGRDDLSLPGITIDIVLLGQDGTSMIPEHNTLTL